MSSLVIRKDESGKLAGMGEKGARAYGKFKRQVEAMQVGDTIAFSWKAPRSLPHHRLFFAQLGDLFDSQEQFDDVDQMRKWLTVGAGYCDFVPGPAGRMVALPKSIAFEEMDEADFGEYHAAVLRFLWTKPARSFMWGHLTEQQSYEMVERFTEEATA